ncbi:MAG: hypothetical protein AAF405_08375 [Pseudomonadota bacterium]
MDLKSKLIGAAMGVAALTALATTPASAAYHGNAINACAGFNEYQPVEVMEAIDNGAGYSLVWLSDADGELWMCHASNNGDIYAYEYVSYDLLEGTGFELLEVMNVSTERLKDQDIAEQVCVSAAAVEPAYAIASRPDGLPTDDFVAGYSVFLQDGAGDFYLCNASGDASIWAWAPLGKPINSNYVS